MPRWVGKAVLTLAAAGGALAVSVAFAQGLDGWWSPGDGRPFPSQIDYPNEAGILRVLLADGPMPTKGHPFFAPIGPNGRACVTCHQPADAMSLSAKTARERWDATGGKDPLFAASDGSNCPTAPQGEKVSHSLLLEHGLIRIQRPWPPKTVAGEPMKPDFEMEVVRDPTGCNTGKTYGLSAAQPNVSVYRRPRPVANMKYLLAVGFAYDPKQGMPLPLDPESGRPMSGNLMADGRAGTLNDQMRDAAATHLEFTKRLSARDMRRIVDFEGRVYAAQQFHVAGGMLDDAGSLGGPQHLAKSEAGQLGSIGKPVWSEFEAWEKNPGAVSMSEKAFRQSVARGARVFRDKTFLITDSAGINSPIGFGNPVRNSCVFCHNMSMMGNDVAPGQVDLGTTTQPFADPAPHLPLFRIRCLGEPHPHYGRTILTNDPGYALTTGRCADVGKITLQSMRGLASRAPYFSNGSAKDLRAVVDYYERRYGIGYTEQEKQDLVNLMSAL
jgi:cytochrome c peroxidase